MLAIPALLALTVLVFARWAYPRPKNLEVNQQDLVAEGITLPFWIYLAGASLVAAGYADFPLIAYHFQKVSVLPASGIPIAYALAMGINTITAPWLGHLYDRKGFSVLLIITVLTCFFSPFIFLGGIKTIFIG